MNRDMKKAMAGSPSGLRLQLVAALAMALVGYCNIGCRPLGLLTLEGDNKDDKRAHERVLIHGRVGYACLIWRPAGEGLLVLMEDQNKRVLASARTSADGEFVVTSPEMLDDSLRLYLRVEGVRSNGVKVDFDGNYEGHLNAPCPDSTDSSIQGAVYRGRPTDGGTTSQPPIAPASSFLPKEQGPADLPVPQ